MNAQACRSGTDTVVCSLMICDKSRKRPAGKVTQRTLRTTNVGLGVLASSRNTRRDATCSRQSGTWEACPRDSRGSRARPYPARAAYGATFSIHSLSDNRLVLHARIIDYRGTTPYTMPLRYVRATARYLANGTPCNKSYPDISEYPLSPACNPGLSRSSFWRCTATCFGKHS